MEGDLFTYSLISNPPVAPPTDEEVFTEVIVRARKGDQVAFAKLFHMYHSQIFTYLIHMVGTKEEGEDLTQETFIKAWKSLSSLNDSSRFKSWLYSIATRVALDHLRHSKLSKLFQQSAVNLDISIEQEDNRAPLFDEQVAGIQHIQQTLRQMSPQYRICILLHYEAGFKQHEIAKLLNTSCSNINAYIRRGCEQFRQIYQQLEQGTTNLKRRESAR